ncbi:MAG: hypothetical protein ACOX02_04340 [Acholeplasmatales bacterium]
MKRYFKDDYITFVEYLDKRFDVGDYIRKQERIKKYYEMFFLSSGYLVFNINDYQEQADVGSRNNEIFENYILWFPARYCWGVFNHVEYSFLYDELNEKSKSIPQEENYYYHEDYFERGDKNYDDTSQPLDFNFD